MESEGIYRVRPLEEGALFVTKQMEATSGRLLPRHRASVESVLVVVEGGCIISLPEIDRALEAGDSWVLPADTWHQIRANPAFKAIHVMPKEIRFDFSI